MHHDRRDEKFCVLNPEQHRVSCAFYPPPVQDRPIFILYPRPAACQHYFRVELPWEEGGGRGGGGLFRVNDEWLRDAHSSMCLGNLTFTVKYVFRCRMRFQTRRNRCRGNWVGNLRSFSVYVRTYVRVYANFGLKFNLVQVLDSWISGK